MRKKMPFFFMLAFSSLTLLAQQKLTVAVAANMQYTIQELIKEFNKTNKTKIEVVLGASGKLTQQILNGAPFDIFISADVAFPDKLEDYNYTLEDPKVYAQGVLVLWSAKPAIQPAKDLKLLVSPKIKSIAIANPQTAPYGSAAEAILKKYKLYDIVSSKLVTGENITQTSQFIATQNADIGFTAKSIVISSEMKGKGKWVELNTGDYPPIEQAAALLKQAKQSNEATARQFYNFLFSAKAKAIYNKFGYIVK
ncbi:molybdate ABC transporter substrate-binding protein [Niastella yeongjuensis]|uniref:Molybdate ABC transporter substrate-binding protein n=1 Tax=Niastella yeongjuensis TaxID=354355 RepID=A0A1V9E486_9BACT|nr:molybdate ABC transporter substrate-binding protein [Niastella yeongjuensis]OQP40834.1 molybdate ABC transporter substrate-binding protein [Niastella yeongjuensis]SEP00183.1 molybdate transport system substrate-binding protein [Niastella yeongjuensis]